MLQSVENINGKVSCFKYEKVKCKNKCKLKYLVGDGQTYFERGCAVHGEVSRREGRNCVERVGTYKTRMWYCICDNKDGCNSAPYLKQSLWAYLFIPIQIAIYKFIFSSF
jgi:hypothetical protein